ncbi:MAG: FMN-binding protein, partial [Planctomycetaceae bacterium]|nr:FMN-binding protein [Planctomycetaceae bacterium]
MSTLSRSFLPIKSMAGRLIIVYRVFVFVAIVLLIHIQHRQWQIEMLIAERDLSRLLPLVQDVFPDAASITPASPAEKADSGLETMGNLLAIENRDGELSGYAVRTSPAADHIIGFSGPTDVLVTADTKGRIRKVKILSSLDTRDHVQEILDNQYFLPAFGSHSLQDMRRAPQVEAVSGATLTSLAILESLQFALNEDPSSENSPDGKLTHRSEVSLKFPEPPQLKDVQIIFPEANSVSASNQSGPGKWIVTNASGIMLGH